MTVRKTYVRAVSPRLTHKVAHWSSPSWFVEVVNELTLRLTQVAVYHRRCDRFRLLSDGPVKVIRALYERLRDINISHSKARRGATNAMYLGRFVSPVSARPATDKVSTLMKIPTSRTLRQARGLMGAVG